MKKPLKQSLLLGAAVATFGLTGLTGIGMASAATDTGGQTSLIEKLASTFNIDKDQVAVVFSADRSEHQAQMQADQAAKLAQAVTDGKLTQAQANYITTAQKDINTLMSSAEPGQESDATRTSVHQKMEALQTWAKANNIDGQYLGGGHGGPDGPGGPGQTPPASDTSAN